MERFKSISPTREILVEIRKVLKRKRTKGHEEEIKLGLFKTIRFRLFGQVYLEHRTLPGWRGALPFYAFSCPTHGIVVNYPQGYQQRLECPKCFKELEALRTLSGKP